MSRWTTRLAWAWRTASQRIAKAPSRSVGLSECALAKSVIGAPRTYSIAKNGRPSSVTPEPRSLGMDSCRSAASWRCSLTNLARALGTVEVSTLTAAR